MAEAPTEVIADILSRLPVKTLQRLKTVSKAWYNLISDPWFVDLHRQRSRRNLNVLYITSEEELNIFGLYRTNLTFTWADGEGNISEVFTKTLKLCTGELHYFNCVSSYNDLICFKTWSWGRCEHIYLYNPVSHQVFALPERKIFLNYPYATFGFGYVSSTREYKVLRLFADDKLDKKCEILTFCPHSDGSNPCPSWRAISDNLPYPVRFCKEPVFVRECFHWLTLGNSYPSVWGEIIISFDLRTEKFSTLPLPTELNNGENSLMKLIVDDFEGKLFLVKYQHHVRMFVRLWVLEDYDKYIWNRTYDIDFRTECEFKMHPRQIDYIHIYGYMPNGELFVLCHDTEKNFYSHCFYNAKSHSMRRVPTPIQKTTAIIPKYSFYWESMVTL